MYIKIDRDDLLPLVREIVAETLRETAKAPDVAHQAPVEPLLLTAKQVAELLQCCERTVLNMAKAGELSVVTFRGLKRFRPDDVRRWIETGKPKAQTVGQKGD